ncbi:MAG: response regulator [Myxococcota bacterium]
MSIAPCVFVVEDEPLLRQALLKGLKSNLPDRGIHAFSSVEDALEQMDELKPQFVVSDIRLPGLSGVALLLHISRSHPKTRVALMSADGPFMGEDGLQQRGAVEFLRKPFAVSQLVEVVRRHTRVSGGTQSTVQGIALQDILQVLHYGRRSARVLIDAFDAKIEMRDGEFVFAQCGELIGIDAVCTLLAQPEAGYQVFDDDSRVKANIEGSFSFVMLESARRHDVAGGAPE